LADDLGARARIKTAAVFKRGFVVISLLYLSAGPRR
jgi:hypothetical protein